MLGVAVICPNSRGVTSLKYWVISVGWVKEQNPTLVALFCWFSFADSTDELRRGAIQLTQQIKLAVLGALMQTIY